MTTREQRIAAIEKDWAENPRWAGIKRGYTAADVERLRGSFPVEYTLARRGAEERDHHQPPVLRVDETLDERVLGNPSFTLESDEQRRLAHLEPDVEGHREQEERSEEGNAPSEVSELLDAFKQ